MGSIPKRCNTRNCDSSSTSQRVAFVLKGYPRLSETFIAQEILSLEKRGLKILIVSLRQPTDIQHHPIHEEIKAPVIYLPEFPLREPVRVLRAWWRMRASPGYASARDQWLKDVRRDFTAPRFRAFPQALVLANEAPAELSRIHAHFLHTPASVARYASRILELPWSCSAHARDIWTTPDWELSEKLDDLDWLVTCTAVGREHLASLARDKSRVELVYHGLDFSRFPMAPRAENARDGSSEKAPVIILSVGRAVEKKGYGCLLDALARLPEQLHWRFVHIGYGPLLAELQSKAEKLSIEKRITWMGAQPQDKVISHYQSADMFVLANCVAADGDMDGLPNVMMEAQSQGLACISTRLSAIPELIEDGVTGMLVPPDKAESFAEALERLISQPRLRSRLGEAGSLRVRKQFSHEIGADQLADKFGLAKTTARKLARRA
jgi:glycosyltransferase involved in cell wall biosynthesis